MTAGTSTSWMKKKIGISVTMRELRIHHEIGAHHAGDRAARAHHRHRRVRVRPRLRQRGRHAAQQVEDDEARVAHAVLDVVAEDPQVEHVAADVHQAAVQEHRGEQRDQRELGGHQAVREDERLPARAERELVAGTPARSRTMMLMVTTGVDRDGMTSRRGIIAGRFSVAAGQRQEPPGSTVPASADDLPTLWNRDSRQGADLLSLREGDRRTADHAADRRVDLRRPEAIALAAHRRRRRRAAGAARLVGSLRVVSTATSRGLVHGVAAYSLWGLFPLYWKMLTQVPALEVLAHRIVWSCVLLLGLVEWRRRSGTPWPAAVGPRGRRLRGGGGADRHQLVSVRVGASAPDWCCRPASATSSPRSSAWCSAWRCSRERLRPLQWAAVAVAARRHGVSGAFGRGHPVGVARPGQQLRRLQHREEAGAACRPWTAWRSRR